MYETHRMWRHVKTQGIYEVLGVAEFGGSLPMKDMDKVNVLRRNGAWDGLDVVPTDWTGDVKQLIAEATVQAEGALNPHDCVVVYRGTDGEHWVRKESEFYSSKFVKLADDLQTVIAETPAAAPPAPELPMASMEAPDPSNAMYIIGAA